MQGTDFKAAYERFLAASASSPVCETAEKELATARKALAKVMYRRKQERTEDFGISFKDGLAEGWVFGVSTAFRKQLDIIWQQYVDKEKTKELRKKNPGLRWENGQLPTVYRMSWSRGVPPLLCFEVGDVAYDPPSARNMAWVDALTVLRRIVQVKSAKPNTKPGAGGWVKFDLRHYNAGKVVVTEEHTLSQTEFESFLRTGQLPVKAEAPTELVAEPAL